MAAPLRIVMVSAEMESLARTGGLGDVVEAVSAHVARLGAEMLVVTPRYGVTRVPAGAVRWDETVAVRVGWGPDDVREVGVVELARAEEGRLRVCLVDDPGLFGRAGLYGDAHGPFGDNDLRFATLSRAALEIAARAWGALPDVIHAHDWHAALAIVYARLTMGEAWTRVKSVMTIHNLAYQGAFGEDALDRLAIPREAFGSGALNHFGAVNLMKGAVAYADRVTAVSPTNAREIQTRDGGFGLDGFLREQAHKIVGILNGIDTARFDPRTDAGLAARYDASTLDAGRAACKAALLGELGLGGEPAQPLFASVSRLTWQKGIDLFLGLVPMLVERGAHVALVGQGEPELEARMLAVAERFPGRVAARVAFDGGLARRIYAGSDFFVVPSRYEPCGLTQMYAMRYGAVPIVTAVGGLRDTVTPVRPAQRQGTGIVAEHASARELAFAMEDALTLYADAPSLHEARSRAMARDSSWTSSAAEYLSLYRDLAK
jgi:starch synthase